MKVANFDRQAGQAVNRRAGYEDQLLRIDRCDI